jgi:hypothetical protein
MKAPRFGRYLEAMTSLRVCDRLFALTNSLIFKLFTQRPRQER